MYFSPFAVVLVETEFPSIRFARWPHGGFAQAFEPEDANDLAIPTWTRRQHESMPPRTASTQQSAGKAVHVTVKSG
jgi:hypothetical protein